MMKRGLLGVLFDQLAMNKVPFDDRPANRSKHFVTGVLDL